MLVESSKHVVNPSWNVIRVPSSYMQNNFPIISVVCQNENVAVVGKNGFVVYNRKTFKWRRFGNVNHEEKIKAVFVCWWNSIVFIINEVVNNSQNDADYQLLCFSKFHLDLMSVLATKQLKNRGSIVRPSSMTICNDILVIGYLNFCETFSLTLQGNKLGIIFLASYTFFPQVVSCSPRFNDCVLFLHCFALNNNLNCFLLYSNFELWHFELMVGALPRKKLVASQIFKFTFFHNETSFFAQEIHEFPLFQTFSVEGMSIWFYRNEAFYEEFVIKLEDVSISFVSFLI